MTVEYGVPPQSQNSLDYAGALLSLKPGLIWTGNIPPGTSDTNYAIGTEAIVQSTGEVYIRVPTSDVWVLLASTPPGTVPVVDGGTGRTSLTDHAILVGAGTSPVNFVGPAASGTVLQGAGGSADPAFSTTTYPATSTQGDVVYASANNVYSNLAKNTSATRYLSNTGVSNAPAWAQVDLTNGVTGVLPQANGGTGSATFFINGAVETTDATPTTLISFACGATAGVYTFDIKIAGFANVGASAPLGVGYTIVGAVRTDGATATFINQAVDAFEEGAMSACAGTLTASGNNAIVQITGVAAYTIDWVGQMTSVFADATT